ncbi:nickel pincer cofactor biosynthesis protein LarB [Desulfopila inferna]|uniref:nickel pincer cofactor biosynthesis protein LarB n=1 Tax=Desulfopila inferna TaxID=468528 RepID=UPI001F06569F|nr:nickel pincer cofactor biosynthesis protein LarB [Desulfopila inferna]
MKTLLEILTSVKNGQCDITEALQKIQAQPAETIEDACLDHQRAMRTGIPEVVFGESKSAEQITAIATSLLKKKDLVLVTRVEEEKAVAVQKHLPQLGYHRKAGILCGNPRPAIMEKCHGKVVIVCAGTSDIPVAEEARVTAESLGHPVEKLYDVGVAGLHRLLVNQPLLSTASVIIVVAGMEGALPSVVSGLVSAPVIGVPTSIGYGANLGGFTALLGMLNSCAPGLAVVNIDNGFGAACMAVAINTAHNTLP